MQDSVSVAANSVSSNVLSGQLYEFVRAGTRVVLSGTGSATGLRTTLINGVPIVNDQAINLQNRFPILPDDIISSFRSPGGRLVLTFRNSTGGAITAFWRVDIS
jgi:hypothetical protein